MDKYMFNIRLKTATPIVITFCVVIQVEPRKVLERVRLFLKHRRYPFSTLFCSPENNCFAYIITPSLIKSRFKCQSE